MSRCPACTAEIPPSSRFCLKCGVPVSAADPAEMETMAMEAAAAPAPAFAKPAATPRPASPHAPHSGNSGIPAYRFEPGTLLASRYRIISRLGKGGMGEVFRADDIMLGQPVALKFLTESAAGNLSLLTRFYDEVRIARQITHANVCRVYDIGEVEGQPYLSMEYIDGEDLGSLLRRIGRLPADKATEFARKMCAGLAEFMPLSINLARLLTAKSLMPWERLSNLGGSPATYCPTTVQECPAGNQTIFAGMTALFVCSGNVTSYQS